MAEFTVKTGYPEFLEAYNQSSISITQSVTTKEIVNLTLPAGTWLLFGNIAFKRGGEGRRSAYIGTSVGTDGEIASSSSVPYTATSAKTIVNLSGVYIATQATTVYLCGGIVTLEGDSTSVAAGDGKLKAVKIA